MPEVNYINDASMPPKSAGSLAESSEVIGSIKGNTKFVYEIFTLDTSTAYVSGDVLADTQIITEAMRANDFTGILQSFMILDEDNVGIAIDVIFLDANVSIGTENSPLTITDANARHILGIVSIASTDFVALVGSKLATKTNIGMLVKPATGTKDLYVALVARGAGTFTVNGLKARFGFMQD